jgi:DNA topoisomerase IB
VTKTSPRLRRSDCRGDGIGRRRAGRGFTYWDPGGERVEDEETLARIGDLAIPPAWGDVWICLDPHGHLQATGIDAAGRKQYLYHERWELRQSERKFAAAREFAAALPRLRRAVTTDLRRSGMPRERALACAVRLLDLGFFRVGGEAYSKENDSYGLATVRREHVTVSNGEISFDFPAKSGQRRVQAIRDPGACNAVEAMRRRRTGPDDLIVWRDRHEWRNVRSDDVNDYIKSKAGDDHSAKDFRTWHGTVLAAVALAHQNPATSKSTEKRAVQEAMHEVADALGNTPAVCRRSYVDPRVIERYRDGETIAPAVADTRPRSSRERARLERAVLSLIG